MLPLSILLALGAAPITANPPDPSMPFGLGLPFAIAISPDGRHAYVPGVIEDSLLTFERDLVTGALTFVEVLFDGRDGVGGLDEGTHLAISPDGAYLYTAAFRGDAIGIFSRDVSSGRLTFIEAVLDNQNGNDGLNGARFLLLSDDGQFLYAAGRNDHAVSVFSRDAVSGRLTQLQVLIDGVGGVGGTRRVDSMVFSPLADFLYTSSTSQGSIAIFSRDPGTGLLTFVDAVINGEGGVSGMERPSFLAMPSDGTHLYVGGGQFNRLITFTRDGSTGGLTFRGFIEDGVGGALGLQDISFMTFAAGDTRLYLGAQLGSSVSVYERNPTTGALTHLQSIFEGQGGVQGLGGVMFASLSPGEEHFYTVGDFGPFGEQGSVSLFSRDGATGLLTYQESLIGLPPIGTEERFAGGDPNKRYFLTSYSPSTPQPASGSKLLLVMAGGDGGDGFAPFIRNIHDIALSEDYALAHLISVEWTPGQFNNLVWPTETNPWPSMQFSTEEFLLAVINDVKQCVDIDDRYIFTLGWSSSGSPSYAFSLYPSSPVTGSFIAMSIFNPASLPPLSNAAGRPYYLLHSPEDAVVPATEAIEARNLLLANGATVELQPYAGGHGWHGDIFGLQRAGIEWLEGQVEAQFASRAMRWKSYR